MYEGSRLAVLIAERELTNGERSLLGIVKFFGIECLALESAELESAHEQVIKHGVAGYSVLMSASRLAGALGTSEARQLPTLLKQAESLFVFDFDSSKDSGQLLQSLTGTPDAQIDIQGPSKRKVGVAPGIPAVCGPLSGVTAECSTENESRMFVGVRSADGFRSVMVARNGDVFFECRYQGSRLFLSVCGPSLDIDRSVDGSVFDIRRCFDSIVPVAFFLKSAFPAAFWKKQDVSAALIVDDPSIKRRYGFLDFDGVLGLMDRHNFCTTIAFIPWNWRRTNRRTAEVFRQNPNRYTLAVHGCDHTSHEFGTSSLPVLNQKIKTARYRAHRHLQRTGIPISPIMVFPQGVFSPEAARALKCNSFIAAVNTDVNAVGQAAPRTLVRELWDVAIMQHFSFPIFTRRYMSDGLENFAFDAFLQKPCLLVEHHEVFRDGARELTTFVDALNSLAGGVKWRSLEHAIMHSYLSQEKTDGCRRVRMFANVMVFENQSTEITTLLVAKRESDRSAIRVVRCNGDEVEYAWEAGLLQFRVDVPAKVAALIEVEYVDSLSESCVKESTRYRIGVAARRYLSELRDDSMSRSELVRGCAQTITRLLK
jgi:hypothetical protein